jgi:2,3-bisphosphoglycerate-independent phosphoglycerate mutase
MNEFIRPKPLCLIIISGLHPDYLFDNRAQNLKNLVNNYPFLTLSSSRKNVDDFCSSYVELGSGNLINEKKKISLSQVVSDAGLTQLHLSDSESYAYTTYFFNNKNKLQYSKEDWFKTSLAQFDSSSDTFFTGSNKLTKKLIKEINKQYYDFIVVNYYDLLLSSDKIRALDNLDKKIKDVIDLVLSFNGALLISSNSSLIESNNVVPLFLVSKSWKNKTFVSYDYQREINKQDISGDITQISPTILKILGLSKPREMKTNSLI